MCRTNSLFKMFPETQKFLTQQKVKNLADEFLGFSLTILKAQRTRILNDGFLQSEKLKKTGKTCKIKSI